MKAALIASAAALSLLVAAPSYASLAVGTTAPDFKTRGALGGEIMDVQLSSLLKKGPVVIFFFPAAFTQGCTVQSREFAAEVDKFKTAGATVLGMSADPVEKLADFSTKECGSKIAMASAGPNIIKGYDVPMVYNGTTRENVTHRTSYVIGKSGKIHYVFSNLAPAGHVQGTLTAVQALKNGG